MNQLRIGRETPPLALSNTALFLDLDGTLAPIASRPEAVGPDPRRTDLMERLSARLGGRLAVISGRTIPDLDRILEHRVTALAGVHGLTRRDTLGALHTADPAPGYDAALTACRAFAKGRPGVIVEDKGLSVAVHYRLAPELAGQAIAETRRIARRTELDLQPGRMVVELRARGPSKGDSLEAFMAEPRFQGARPIFVGDDLTDEDGFAAARDLGGYGVMVGPERPTAARYRLDDVEAALAWLEAAR